MPITIPGSCEPGICVFGGPVPAGGRAGCRAGRGAAGRLSGGARAAAAGCRAGLGRRQAAAGGVDQRRPAPTRIPGGEFHVKSIFFHFTWDFFRSVKKLQETPMSNQIELCHNESSRVEEKRLNCRLTRFE